ncbi:MAG: colanic acid/amylovoran biosynthesis protein [Blastocatellia bacterium]|nr:colanic acid/amylovoran biosynthesis protein [Blastocatellia bacterium]
MNDASHFLLNSQSQENELTIGPARKELQIGLLWHTFGHGNLGIDALARGDATLIRRAAHRAGLSVRFLSLGSGQSKSVTDLPSDVSIGPAPQLKPFLRLRFDFYKAIRDCNIVFDIGEGDSFTDIYGLRRYIVHIFSKSLVLQANKPLIFAPQTIGPFDNPSRRRIAVALMRKAAGVFTRDNLSTTFIKENGLTKNSDEYIDVAFALPFERQKRPAGRLRVGLNASGLLYNNGYTGKNEFGMTVDFKALCHRLIEKLVKNPEVEIHLIAHVHGPGDDPDNDAPVMRALAQQYPALIMAPLFETSEQAKSYMSSMDFVVAGRMHACIGAYSAGVPVVPIAYSRKFNGLFNTLGYEYYVDGKTDTVDGALEKILSAFDKRDTLKLELEKGLRIAEDRLKRYENRLVQILSHVSSEKL